MKKQDLILRLEQQLHTVTAERQAGHDSGLHAARLALKHFQSTRLAHTHADLLAADDTHGAALFFLEELYGTHDLSQRDVDLARIIPTLGRLLNAEALHAITEAIVLDALSERLDSAMAGALGMQFDHAAYCAAYVRCTSRADRERQLELVQELGDALCALVRIPLLSTMLAVMRKPAKLAGLGELQRFLERGFCTFKQMREPRQFVHAIVSRERQVLENIFGGRPDPLGLGRK
jgi:hypothetical protein